MKILIAMITLVAATPASAQLVQAEANQIAKLLQDSGYKAEIKENETSGNPYIQSAASGYNFTIGFYGCDNRLRGTPCKTIQFYSWFTPKAPIALTRLNEWNLAYRWGRAALDDEGDIMLAMDVDLEDRGVSRELFIDNIEYWETTLATFSDFIFPEDLATTPAAATP